MTTPVVFVRPRGRPKDRELAQRRREQILDAAMRFFARHGYYDSDVQALADELRLGKGTLYRYFPSKRAMFLAAVDRGMRRLRAAVEAARKSVSDPLEQLARATTAYLAFFDAHPELAELFIQERAAFKDRRKPTYFEHRAAHVGPWVDLFRGLIAAGRVRRLPAEQIVQALGDLFYGTMLTNFLTGRRQSFERQVRELLDIVFHGILKTGEKARRLNGEKP